jgi:L-alanine-DL-glutamate epimerase-like enolase superfamily enzyme
LPSTGGTKIYRMQLPGQDQAEACVREVRNAVGRDVGTMIDLDDLDDPYLALEAGRRFEAYGLFWFEVPVTSDALDTLGYIRFRVRMRMVSGERHGGKPGLREILEKRAVGVLNPDMAGWRDTRGARGRRHGGSALGRGIAAQLPQHDDCDGSDAPRCRPDAEPAHGRLYPDYLACGARFAETGFDIAAGEATLPRSPGLGVTINEDALSRVAVGTTAIS